MKSAFHINFVDLQRQYRRYRRELLDAMEKVLEGSDFILGDAVARLETAFARYIGCRFAVGVDSGTSALELAIKAMDLGPGDEVITVPNSFISTAYAISASGAQVVFVDVDERTQLMDCRLLEKTINRRTKAVIPVHLFGQMAMMSDIMRLARRHRLAVIEDACQAHGSSQYGRKAGSLGHFGCFSFYPGKNLGAYGDAGLITTNSSSHYRKLLLLRNYGSPVKYRHILKGRNARLDSLQAAVLNVKLKYLDVWNERRQEIAAIYHQKLNGIGDLILPYIEPYNKTNYHLFVMRTKRRNELFQFLTDQGIQTVIHYPVPIHRQKAYAELNLRKGSFPVTEKLSREILSLPIHPELEDKEALWVCDRIKRFFMAGKSCA